MITQVQTPPDTLLLESDPNREPLPADAPTLRWQYILQCVGFSLPLMLADWMVVLLCTLPISLLDAVAVNDFWLPIGASSLAVFAFYTAGIYHSVGLPPEKELRHYVSCTTVILAAAAFFSLVSRSQLIEVAEGGFLSAWMVPCLSVMTWVSLCVTLPTVRYALRRSLSQTRWWGLRSFLVGPLRLSPAHARKLEYLGVKIVGRSPELGAIDNAEFRARRVATIIQPESIPITVPMTQVPRVITYGANFECSNLGPTQVGSFEGTQRSAVRRSLPTSRFTKRMLDLSLLMLASPVLLPVIAAIAAVVKWTSPGSIFYKQHRIGKQGSQFFVWKFRTMVTNAEETLQEHLRADPELMAEWESHHKLRNDPRVTKVGQLLRKTSLDELPQLFNILIGNMSLVGPRPIPVYEETSYRKLSGEVGWHNYCESLPGLTGLWQINGRNNTTYEERIEYDSMYTGNWSIWLDLYILLSTIKTVLLREGAY